MARGKKTAPPDATEDMPHIVERVELHDAMDRKLDQAHETNFPLVLGNAKLCADTYDLLRPNHGELAAFQRRYSRTVNRPKWARCRTIRDYQGYEGLSSEIVVSLPLEPTLLAMIAKGIASERLCKFVLEQKIRRTITGPELRKAIAAFNGEAVQPEPRKVRLPSEALSKQVKKLPLETLKLLKADLPNCAKIVDDAIATATASAPNAVEAEREEAADGEPETGEITTEEPVNDTASDGIPAEGTDGDDAEPKSEKVVADTRFQPQPKPTGKRITAENWFKGKPSKGFAGAKL